jgi:CYTH domain-containing protein
MAKELERKFLVILPQLGLNKIFRASQSYLINQGYLASSEGAMVRVRTYSGKGFLTVKCTKEDYEDFEVDEYEYEIPHQDAIELLERCEHKLQKVRFKVNNSGDIWDVDVYTEALTGLITAEFEHEDREKVLSVELPKWIDRELTGIKKYSNFQLTRANKDET